VVVIEQADGQQIINEIQAQIGDLVELRRCIDKVDNMWLVKTHSQAGYAAEEVGRTVDPHDDFDSLLLLGKQLDVLKDLTVHACRGHDCH